MSRQAKLALLILLGALALAAILIAIRPEPEEQEDIVSTALVQTVPYQVTSGPIDIYASGTVQPREEVTLGAEISGKLTYVNPAFREGRSLAAGTLLFRIDQSEYANRVRSAQADVAAQDVALLQAQEEAAIAAAELQQFAQREEARNALSRSIDTNDYAARIRPPEQLQQAAEGAPDDAQSSAAAQPNILATREPQLRSAEAARERAAAQLEDANLAMQRTEVRAPFAGLVRSESAAIGTLVQPGQSLGSIVASDFFEVRVSLNEGEAGLLPSLFAASSARIPAQVVLDYGDISYRWAAFVDRVDPILDPETRMINVFLRVPAPMRAGSPVEPVEQNAVTANAAPPLLLGSFVQARITGNSPQPYARIPLQALRTGNEVWLLAQGRLQVIAVRVIQRSDSFAFVAADALGEGGHVIISSLQAPVTGMELRSEAESTDGE